MNKQTKGTHEYQDDPRNAEIIIDINGEFFAREQAQVSVFDSGFVLGDGVWAKHWYGSIWSSTGFTAYRKKDYQLSAKDQRISRQAQPYYEELYQHRLRP